MHFKSKILAAFVVASIVRAAPLPNKQRINSIPAYTFGQTEQHQEAPLIDAAQAAFEMSQDAGTLARLDETKRKIRSLDNVDQSNRMTQSAATIAAEEFARVAQSEHTRIVSSQDRETEASDHSLDGGEDVGEHIPRNLDFSGYADMSGATDKRDASDVELADSHSSNNRKRHITVEEDAASNAAPAKDAESHDPDGPVKPSALGSPAEPSTDQGRTEEDLNALTLAADEQRAIGGQQGPPNAQSLSTLTEEADRGRQIGTAQRGGQQGTSDGAGKASAAAQSIDQAAIAYRPNGVLHPNRPSAQSAVDKDAAAGRKGVGKAKGHAMNDASTSSSSSSEGSASGAAVDAVRQITAAQDSARAAEAFEDLSDGVGKTAET